MLANGAEPRGESVDVTQNGRGGQPLFQGGRGRADLAGVTGARLEPPLQQIYFGAQILVAAAAVSPACQDPIIRSPAGVISQTVPSGSTRPNR